MTNKMAHETPFTFLSISQQNHRLTQTIQFDQWLIIFEILPIYLTSFSANQWNNG